MVEVKVFQGSQIGGCSTVITSTYKGETHRIMIDYGSSLPGSGIKKDFDYPWEEEPVDAVFFTHYHGDHAGRLLEIPEHIPIYMGETARKVLLNIHGCLMHGKGEKRELHRKEYELLMDESRVHTFHYDKQARHYDMVTDIKNFSIEPYSVDHSAYDAYMFLIEALDEEKASGKKVIVHTGDFRGHGRRGKAMLKMIDYYIHQNRKYYPGKNKREVDILITEGTMMSRLAEETKSEYLLQAEAAEYLRRHKHAFLICSSTNLDSLASFYQAWQSACRPYKGYMYTYSDYYVLQLKTFSETAGGFSEVYQFDNVFQLDLKKKLKIEGWTKPKSQKDLMKMCGFLAIIKADFFYEKYIDAFMDCEDKPVIIYSMWDGYLDPDHKAYKKEWHDFLKAQEAKGVEIKHLHTSGHATFTMIEEVIKAMDPQEEIVPIHTENPEAFFKLNIGDELKARIRRTGGGVMSDGKRIECRDFVACRTETED